MGNMTKAIYQIRIGGYLRPEWSERLEGMTITHESNDGGAPCLTQDVFS